MENNLKIFKRIMKDLEENPTLYEEAIKEYDNKLVDIKDITLGISAPFMKLHIKNKNG